MSQYQPLQATEIRSQSSYSVALGVLPIAKLSFETRIKDGRYEIDGQFQAVGLADMVRDISAKSRVSGRHVNGTLAAERYELLYRNGRKESTYEVAFRDGVAVSTTVTPPPKPRPESWVPVTEADLKGVLDPIGALLISDQGDICRRTIAIYDGESRIDLVLSPKNQRSQNTGGFKGDVTVCGVRYVPRSGYRQGRKDIEYLKSIDDIEIAFARTAQLQLYAPVYARIPTRYGTVFISATRFDG
ncbi:DUF3108 domain-containing protein [Peteryoungia desertarenae]|uniref:DUF3108 domain-containing protein n=1 Tax=Peteryoungia desertarenae TaxID=1813451 RepID=A0ABX6QSI7_9HYPH|nr:DUF3108 domain-containing protein [Peteryoungia desertarenae]